MDDVIRVEPRRVPPAVLVVIGEAAVGERNHAVQGSRAARMPQGLDANVLMVAGVVGFVQENTGPAPTPNPFGNLFPRGDDAAELAKGRSSCWGKGAQEA